MFQPEGFGLKVFQQRYTIHENETWEAACQRYFEIGTKEAKLRLEASG
jgi:hypothetical protein